MDRKVLLIDDDPIANMINRELFEIRGYVVNAYTNPKEALEYLESANSSLGDIPDIIMLDINMPEMDGWGFLDEYQKIEFASNNNCRLFMLTSSIASEDKEKAFTYSSVKGFISKPLTMEWVQNL
ncbi:response regulator [Fulvivirga sp. 29W222]|uniref:Response regulator n=1 Tax=Fulvivirga marina TaxID=2494733 RepID=A0A937G1J3_9BACT|nr:response regulator [Fulvivirga marina]MBL6448887.1 response regulator [Fulvivirga marina]